MISLDEMPKPSLQTGLCVLTAVFAKTSRNLSHDTNGWAAHKGYEGAEEHRWACNRTFLSWRREILQYTMESAGQTAKVGRRRRRRGGRNTLLSLFTTAPAL